MSCANKENVPMSAAKMRHIATECEVTIVEQPAPDRTRFRYECEGRSAGSIQGISSTPGCKTYPTIKISGYHGKALVIVSCVTKDEPYRPHPHNLIGRDGCKKGVCTLEIPPDTMTIAFPNMGIQCAKRSHLRASLRKREEIRIDPFRTGFDHAEAPGSIDLNAVRLCFQVFLQHQGTFAIPLAPVVSDPIYDKKAHSSLTIVKLSDNASPVDGGEKDIIVLCEKVPKDDIAIRFFEVKYGHVVWEEIVPICRVHRRFSLWFRPPCYKDVHITEPVDVFLQLLRPLDGTTSEPVPFKMLPVDFEPKRKRQKTSRSYRSPESWQKTSRSYRSPESLQKSIRVLTPLNNFAMQQSINEHKGHCITSPTYKSNIPVNNNDNVSSNLEAPLDLSNWTKANQNAKLQEINLSTGELSNLSTNLSENLSRMR